MKNRSRRRSGARPHLLLIGPLPIEGDVIGGTKVSFAGLVSGLEDDQRFEISVQNTSRPLAGRSRLARTLWNLGGLAAGLCSILDPRRRYDVIVFNASSGGALRSGPLVWAAARLRRIPLAVRLFGGDFDLFHDRAGRICHALAHFTFLAAPLFLFQTRMLCERFGAGSGRRWWPTTRDLRPDPDPRPARATRFLFLGQLRREKGIDEVLSASGDLPEGATLTVCGPPMPGYAVPADLASARVDFRGAVPHEGVREVLAAHDVLLFPSYHAGEGMPGILIEALQMGLPVICSAWRALPEIIHHEENGLLVAPRSVSELSLAMQRIARDEALFHRLSAGALRSGELYRRPEWIRLLGDWMVGLANGQEPGEHPLDGPGRGEGPDSKDFAGTSSESEPTGRRVA
jgi:glycosyltransferase involved in cell wall biosynthesis